MKVQDMQIPSFVVDGVSSVATHNGLHRVVLFKHAKQGVGIADSVELVIPTGVANAIAKSLSTLK